jgi:hypothetical protein
VADACRLDLNQNLALAGPVKVEIDDFERFLGFKGDGCTRFHDYLPPASSDFEFLGACPRDRHGLFELHATKAHCRFRAKALTAAWRERQ